MILSANNAGSLLLKLYNRNKLSTPLAGDSGYSQDDILFNLLSLMALDNEFRDRAYNEDGNAISIVKNSAGNHFVFVKDLLAGIIDQDDNFHIQRGDDWGDSLRALISSVIDIDGKSSDSFLTKDKKGIKSSPDAAASGRAAPHFKPSSSTEAVKEFKQENAR